MSGSLNKAILIGNLAKDPEIRRTQDGQPIANLLVAPSARWRDKSGERHERSEFHRVVIFAEELCKIVEQFLKKGSKVYVEGSIHTRKYLDHQSGQEKFSTEVQLQTYGSKLILLDPPPSAKPAARHDEDDDFGADYKPLAKGLPRGIDPDLSHTIDEHEFTRLATEHAQRVFSSDRPDVTFAKNMACRFTSHAKTQIMNEETGHVLAWDPVRNCLVSDHGHAGEAYRNASRSRCPTRSRFGRLTITLALGAGTPTTCAGGVSHDSR